MLQSPSAWAPAPVLLTHLLVPQFLHLYQPHGKPLKQCQAPGKFNKCRCHYQLVSTLHSRHCRRRENNLEWFPGFRPHPELERRAGYPNTKFPREQACWAQVRLAEVAEWTGLGLWKDAAQSLCAGARQPVAAKAVVWVGPQRESQCEGDRERTATQRIWWRRRNS